MGNLLKTKGICPNNRNFAQTGDVQIARTTTETYMTARPIFHHLDIPSGAEDGTTIPFEMQPIVQIADGRVKACELLYRGARPADWAKVDAAVISFLSTPQTGLPPVFINLSNDILMAHKVSDFAHVVSANDVTFELSEAVSGYRERAAIADRVNQLIDVGARVALDDFGAGRDGLDRLYSIRDVAAVKLDREFLLTCMKRPDARRMLHMLIAQWRREGIKSIAEGVETEAMFAFAQAADVDLVQGWFVDSLVGMKLMGEGD
jgi:EAL domain-containing protein (putative c-di-GMP-specific phosphodiesterase class I)